MSYDEEQQRRSRVVVETPTARREVYQSQTVRTPERSGYSTGMVAAVALTAIAATAIIFLFLMNSGDDDPNTNIRVTTQPTPMTQAPIITTTPITQPTPIIIEQAPIVTQPAPVVMPPTGTTTMPPVTTTAPQASSSPAPPDDTEVRARVNTAIQKDPDLSTTGIIAEFSDGKATLTGSVSSPDLKNRAARLALTVRGVRRVDNQITVTGAAEPANTP